jgi:hypothetical protein
MAKQGVSAVAAKADPTGPYRMVAHAIAYGMYALAVLFVIIYVTKGMESTGYLIAAVVLAGIAYGGMWLERNYFPSIADQINSTIDTVESVTSPFVTDAPAPAPMKQITPAPQLPPATLIPPAVYPPQPAPTYSPGAVGGGVEGGDWRDMLTQARQVASSAANQAGAFADQAKEGAKQLFRTQIEPPIRAVANDLRQAAEGTQGMATTVLPAIHQTLADGNVDHLKNQAVQDSLTKFGNTAGSVAKGYQELQAMAGVVGIQL